MSTHVLDAAIAAFAEDVSDGLSKPRQKELPSKYLYDRRGSQLFELISELPEYGLTRADERLLATYATEIVERVSGDVVVCELGSGSAKKTRWILEALSRRGPADYFPIEISTSALALCQRELADMNFVHVVGIEGEYLDGLREVTSRRRTGQRLFVLFLGSTIGNFTPPADVEFLRAIRMILQPNDALLLGTDLQKPIPTLIRAYDDPLGITAAFNLNLLVRINRELDADFRLEAFKHLAVFNPSTSSVEMHIQSLRRQTVHIPLAGLNVHFEEGETIWTESSRKYASEEPARVAQESGFVCEANWTDAEWPFAENLLVAV